MATYPPYPKRGRKPAFPLGVSRPRPRYKCQECGAEFWDGRDDDKMFVHSKRHKYYHIGFIRVPSKSYDRRIIQRISFHWEDDRA